MTQRNNPGAIQNQLSSAVKPTLFGGAVALILVSLMVFTVKTPRPEWGQYWMIQPLIITPVIGAMGGLFYFIVNYQGAKWGLNKILTVFIGVLGFIIALWMGIVLGLHGTMWN